MDSGDLKVFGAVARLGSMNRAAAELNTVQSNVTSRVEGLEHDIECTLSYRHNRGVSLTAAGQRLLPYAARAGRKLSDARMAARDDGAPRGLLTIGSLETTAAVHLAPLLAKYAGAYPEVDLVLRAGTTRELIEDVLEQRVDGAYVCGPTGRPELCETTAFREELVMMAAPSVGSLETILRNPEIRIIVLRAGCSYRQMLESLLARRGISVQRVLEFGTLDAIFGCVAAGLGISFLPPALVGAVCAAGRLSVHALPPRYAMVETVFIRLRDRFLSSALRAFVHCTGASPAEAA